MTKFVIFATFILGFVLFTIAQEPIVQIADGQVQGVTKLSDSGRPFSEFLGIPYGKPPLGQLRFRAPQPSDSWTGILNASTNPAICPQYFGTVLGQEDCLYLNVYSPQLPNNSTQPKLPVMVYMYGGGFSTGSDISYIYGPSRFMNKDVVMVIPNYRLGPIGFLSTADEASPGNYGLLDQVLALKWVQNNIAAFGGNPGQVTIQGQSAGAASVSYLILSSAASGLFHAAIGESGSALCPWALQKDPMNATLRLSVDLGCPTDDTTIIVDCLRNKTVEELILSAYNSIGEYDIFLRPLVPVVEDPSYGQFLTDWPLNILNEGKFNKVPVLTGCNKDEGIISYAPAAEYYDVIDDHFFDVILPDLLFSMFKYDRNLINMSYAIKSEYYDKIDLNNASAVARTSIDLNGDAVFKSPNDLNVRKLATSGFPVYTYIFAYPGVSYHNYSGEPEIGHAEELPFLFEFYIPFDENDTAVANNMVTMWTNFATYFNPTPNGSPVQWDASTPAETKYLYILRGDVMYMELDYRAEQIYFWNYIIPQIMFA